MFDRNLACTALIKYKTLFDEEVKICLAPIAAACFVLVLPQCIPAGYPSRCGDVAVYVFDIKQPSLPAPVYSVLVSISVFRPFQLYFIP